MGFSQVRGLLRQRRYLKTDQMSADPGSDELENPSRSRPVHLSAKARGKLPEKRVDKGKQAATDPESADAQLMDVEHRARLHHSPAPEPISMSETNSSATAVSLQDLIAPPGRGSPKTVSPPPTLYGAVSSIESRADSGPQDEDNVPEDEPRYKIIQTYSLTKTRSRYILLDVLTGAVSWGERDCSLLELRNMSNKAVAKLATDDASNSSESRSLDPTLLFPVFESTWMTRYVAADAAPNPYDLRTPADSVYIKIQHMAAHAHKSVLRCSDVSRLLTLQEVKRCEEIRKASEEQQQFLAVYHGVVLDKFNRVTGIAYAQYSMDLHAFTAHGCLRASHVHGIMSCVRRGMAALHELGIVHCDIRPVNILLQIENRYVVGAVIGDFDAAVREGQEIRLKKSSGEWWPKRWGFGDRAVKDIDVFMVDRLEAWMNDRAVGKVKVDKSEGNEGDAKKVMLKGGGGQKPTAMAKKKGKDAQNRSPPRT